MMNNVKPIPDGYTSITPYLITKNAGTALEYYKKTFGATEKMRLNTPDGRLMHAELKIGDSLLMLGEERGDTCGRGPETLGGSPVTIHLYVEDVDAVFALAVDTGSTVVRPVENQFYGDRSGMFTDPFGHLWNVSTHIEDVPPEEIKKRVSAMFAG
jgi:PhnB protein